MSVADVEFDRARATLIGMAIGDAMGMPSQTLSRTDISRHYGRITDFVPPIDDHPVSHGLKAAQVTDDTEQAFLLAQRLVHDHGVIDETAWARDLLGWEEDIRRRGLRDLLGPSSKAALDQILSGAPVEETGRNGTTNGAAMRIAPIGIATLVTPLSGLIDRVETACRMTHNTSEAIAAASAVAAVISHGIGGVDFEAALTPALDAARFGQQRGFRNGEPDIAGRICAALKLAGSGVSTIEFADRIGTSVNSFESIPAAFGIVRLADGDPWKAALIAANIGDDTDTIGAIAGAMAGACRGLAAFDEDKVDEMRRANDLPIEKTARDLLALRNAAAPGQDSQMEAMK